MRCTATAATRVDPAEFARALTGVSAIVASAKTPLDQYVMRHPATFFAKLHGHAVLDAEEASIVAGDAADRYSQHHPRPSIVRR